VGAIELISGISWLIAPALLSSGSQTELELWDTIHYSGLIFFGVLFLIPRRWFMQKKLFLFKLAIITIGSLWLVKNGIEGISDYLTGGKDPLIVPVSVAQILMLVAAPLSLYLKKVIVNSS